MSFEQCITCRWYVCVDNELHHVEWCGHELNPEHSKDNTTEELCPIVGKPEPKYLHHPEKDNE